MNLIGKMIDNRYEILEKIGNGGMATVFKAKCHVLNRYVAVKILRDEFTTDSEFIKRFNSEAQSAASLTHPNIVSIYDVGNEDNLYYIVMELIQGKTLKDIITEDGKLSWKWSINVAMQIASALEMAHKNNIIHRDIKPHNIIITEEGTAKVTDFGIAKAVSNSTITAFGTTIGSVHYFSPEHARGGFTDAKSDLYSLGVVLYEMLTGKVPFDADTPVSVALKQVQEEPIDPITYNPDIPVSVNRIILKAMQKDPSLRYQNATEMIKDLSMALKRPNEDFVVLALRNDDSPTQKVQTVAQMEMEKNNERNAPKVSENTDKPKGKIAKIKEFYSKHGVLKVLTILAVLAIIFFIAAGGVMLAIKNSRKEQAYVPQLVANTNEAGEVILEELLTEEEAINKLKAAGFENYVIERESSDTIEAGYVIKQSPDSYDFLYNIDKEIIITVSSGPEMVTLPNRIIGEKWEEIQKELDKLGVNYGQPIMESNEEVEAGIVLAITPDQGEQITKSTPVSVTVSSGSQYADVEMWSVVGKDSATAIAELEAKNLIVDLAYDENNGKADGIVLAQDIEEGKIVKEQSTVVLTINKLPTKSTITFSVNVASFYPQETVTEEPETGSDENVVSNSTETTPPATQPKAEKVTVEIYIGGISVKRADVLTTESNWTHTINNRSGSEKVQIIIDGTEQYNQNVDFSAGDATINVSK